MALNYLKNHFIADVKNRKIQLVLNTLLIFNNIQLCVSFNTNIADEKAM